MTEPLTLASDAGATYIALVLMSGLCLAPLIMLGLGAWYAGGSRRGRRIAMTAGIVIVLFYALSLLGSNFSWPGLEFHGTVTEAAQTIVFACGGFLVLPWLVAFSVVSLGQRRARPGHDSVPGKQPRA
jgi:hypothetical protein